MIARSNFSFPGALKSHRKANGLTQGLLAEKWGYSKETISAWERGIRMPNSQDIPQVAKFLQITPGELVEMLSVQSGIRQKETLVVDEEEWMDKKNQPELWVEMQSIYLDRTMQDQNFPFAKMFGTSRQILAIGISLNAIALNYSREALMHSVIQNKSSYTLCLLDPDGAKCAEREQEEGLSEGSLTHLIRLNLQTLGGIHQEICKRDPESSEQFQIMTYDLLPRFGIYLFDDTLMTMQFYAYGRGLDTPGFVLKRHSQNGLFEFYAAAARSVLAHSRPVSF